MNIKQITTNVIHDKGEEILIFFGLGEDNLLYRYNPNDKKWILFDATTDKKRLYQPSEAPDEKPQPIKPAPQDPVPYKEGF